MSSFTTPSYAGKKITGISSLGHYRPGEWVNGTNAGREWSVLFDDGSRAYVSDASGLLSGNYSGTPTFRREMTGEEFANSGLDPMAVQSGFVDTGVPTYNAAEMASLIQDALNRNVPIEKQYYNLAGDGGFGGFMNNLQDQAYSGVSSVTSSIGDFVDRNILPIMQTAATVAGGPVMGAATSAMTELAKGSKYGYNLGSIVKPVMAYVGGNMLQGAGSGMDSATQAAMDAGIDTSYSSALDYGLSQIPDSAIMQAAMDAGIDTGYSSAADYAANLGGLGSSGLMNGGIDYAANAAANPLTELAKEMAIMYGKDALQQVLSGQQGNQQTSTASSNYDPYAMLAAMGYDAPNVTPAFTSSYNPTEWGVPSFTSNQTALRPITASAPVAQSSVRKALEEAKPSDWLASYLGDWKLGG